MSQQLSNDSIIMSDLLLCGPCSDDLSSPSPSTLNIQKLSRLRRRRKKKYAFCDSPYGSKHACFACAMNEDCNTSLVKKARTINQYHFAITLATFLCLSCVVSAAPSPAEASNPLLSQALLVLTAARTIVMYTLIAIVPVLAFNTLTCPPRKVDHTRPPAKFSKFDKYGEVLAECLKIPTISHDSTSDEKTDYSQLSKLRSLLASSFPNVHSKLSLAVVNSHSLVYKWSGSDPSLSPIMLCAHLDVVPAPGTWSHPPFAGKIVDGVIWGRGAIDNKHNVVGQLAAVEELLGAGFQPRRTVYLAMGHDEEVSGTQGAAFIAEHMKSVEKIGPNGLAAIFDEGPMMVEGALPGIKGPVALVANSEKGAVTIEIKIEAEGGHSSMPPIKEQNR